MDTHISSVEARHLGETPIEKAEGASYAAHQFELLDGLRGVAALCVFFYHSGNHKIAANGFLLVDFFFILSGFVVAHSYRQRLRDGTMTFGDFVLRRLIRLYPMVFAGVVLGTLVLVAHNIATPAEAYQWKPMVTWVACALFIVPYLATNPFLDAVFPINVVLWSLFLELVANGLYAAKFVWAPPSILIALAAAAMLVLILIGPLDGGGSTTSFLIGFARVTAGFAVGLLLDELYRADFLPNIRIGLVGAALPLMTLTMLPRVTNPLWLPMIYVIFITVIVSALQAPRPERGHLGLCQILGTISYPLYLLHRPLTALTIGFGKVVVPLTEATYPYFVGVSLIVTCAVSVLMVRFYETPLRHLLEAMRRRFARRQG